MMQCFNQTPLQTFCKHVHDNLHGNSRVYLMTIMRVFQFSVTQRNVTQHVQEVLRNKKVLRFFTQRQTPQPQRCFRFLASLLKQIPVETTSVFFRNAGRSEANWTNQSWDYVQPMAAALWNGAVRGVKKYASRCGCSAYAVLRCVT